MEKAKKYNLPNIFEGGFDTFSISEEDAISLHEELKVLQTISTDALLLNETLLGCNRRDGRGKDILVICRTEDSATKAFEDIVSGKNKITSDTIITNVNSKERIIEFGEKILYVKTMREVAGTLWIQARIFRHVYMEE